MVKDKKNLLIRKDHIEHRAPKQKTKRHTTTTTTTTKGIRPTYRNQKHLHNVEATQGTLKIVIQIRLRPLEIRKGILGLLERRKRILLR